MQQVIDFFTGLFASDQWPARWHCGNWSSFHGWLYILSARRLWQSFLSRTSVFKSVKQFYKILQRKTRD